MIGGMHAATSTTAFSASMLPMLNKLATKNYGRLLLQIDNQQFAKLNSLLEDYRNAVTEMFEEHKDVMAPLRQGIIHEDFRKINAKYALQIKDLINKD